MDQFPDGTYMRLWSRVRSTSYLHADEDGVGVSLRPLDRGEGALNAVWRVHQVPRDGIDYALLHGDAYGRYLALSPDEKERAGGHDRGVPAIQRGYDARDLDSITWKPVAVAGANTGGYVLLRHVYNGNLRANGRFRPWSTRVTVEQYLGTETTMRHWTVEVVPPPRQGPPPALPLPTGASSAGCSKVSSSRAAGYNCTNPKAETDVETFATAARQGRYRDHEPHGSEDKSQRRLPTRIGSAKSSLLENIGLQGQSSQLQRGESKKSLALSPRKPIRFSLPKRLSMLTRKEDALDATSENAARKSSLLKGPVSTWEGVTYSSTLGAGGDYGYPHPPPFYKCEICCEKTAFYRLNCCNTVVCDCCACACKSAGKERRLSYQRQKLPKVKLEGSDLFLWQPFSFPDDQMLWMAKRTENRLRYYFAPIGQLMDPQVDPVEVSVYEFLQQGQDVISLSKTDHLFERNQLY